MDDPVADRPQIQASQVVVADVTSKVLATKEGETFLYCDTEGNLDDRKELGLGLYYKDTRFLSHFRMLLSGREPVLLSSSSERAYMSYVDLTNPDLYEGEEVAVPQQTLNVRRIRTINGRLFERIRMKNYNPFPVRVTVELSLGARLRRHLRGPRAQPAPARSPRAAGGRAAGPRSSHTRGSTAFGFARWSSSGASRSTSRFAATSCTPASSCICPATRRSSCR